jgi:hypothetical protein
MKALNNLVIRVSHSGGLFLFSAVLAFGSLFIVFFNINNVFEPIVGAQLFDFQNELTVDQIFEQLPNYNESAVALYYAFVFVDFLFPVFASLTLAAASAFAIRYLSSEWYEKINGLNLFTVYFIPAVFDWIENISAISVIGAYPTELTLAASVLVIAKKGKLAAVMTMQLISWFFLLLALLKWVGRKAKIVK